MSFSSFKKDKLIFENWRRFVNEQEEEAPDTGQDSMEKLLGAGYSEFVKWLGGNIQDPKTLALIAAGQKDGSPGDDRFGFEDGALAVAKLIPTQNEIDIDKSLAYPLVKDPSQLIEKIETDGPFTVVENIITFNGKYIIDGHHRWSTVYACNKNAKITVTNITIEGLDPLDALKAVQMAIGAQTKKIPMQSVEGTNLLKVGESDLKQWIAKNVPRKTSEAIYAAGEQIINKLKQGAGGAKAGINEEILSEISKNRFHKFMIGQVLPRYLWSNVALMQKTSQPVAGAGPRDFMPQTGGINWKEPLAKGQIDIKPPFASVRKKAAE